MQKYKITKFGAKFMRLPAGTTIVAAVGNRPARKLWTPIGEPFGSPNDLFDYIKANSLKK